ncbi:MAG TPA: RHS repeat-associated core domain-containing protein [Candidatus Eisenbacteria bacterium]|nr:RHS repeat-associated core domain-containing protein [Candidatus Eisenbacteria bacterium]
MSRFIRSPKGRLTIYGLLLCGFVLGFVLYRQAIAAPYVNPFWAQNSPSQESAICDVASRAMSCESAKCGGKCCDVTVDVRTGELFWDKVLFTMPGVVQDNVFAIRWRSMIGGASQLGSGMLPSWETTAQYVVLDQAVPNGPNGHRVDIRRPTGRVDAFVWSGTAYTAPSDVFDTLTTVSGNYRLTDKWGNQINFDGAGMPATYVDRNGNTDTFTYTSYKMTGLTDDRGQSYTIVHNGNNYITQITDPAGRAWAFGYDTSDRLTTVTSPATPDQTSGITVTLAWDSLNRLTGITDGRGNSVWAISYVGTTSKVSSISIDGNSVSYTYFGTTRTDRTDRNGNVHRTFYTGNQVTKKCLYEASAEQFITLFNYSGVFPSYTVLPRGNRIDETFDSAGNLTARRHRTQDTSTNDPSDILHQWGYTSNFMTAYTDPLGNQTTYGRDSAGNLTSISFPTVTNPASQTASIAITYNSKGQVTRYTNEEGYFTDVTYHATGSSSDLIDEIEEDAAGLSLKWGVAYDSAGNVSGVTDPLSRTTSYTWDNLRRLTQTLAPLPLSYRVQHHYDGNGNLTSTDVENIDKDGNVVSGNQWITTSRTYTNTDDLATLVEEIDASTTRTTTLEYDNNRNLIRITKPEGNKTKMTYNNRDLLASLVTGEGATGESTEEYTYDDNGNRTVREDGRDNDWLSAYDLFDRLIKETDPLGHYAEYELDKNGQRTKVTSKNSSDVELQRETYYFDERGRHWKTSALFKDPGSTYSDAVTIFERLKTGQVKKVTNPRSKDTNYTYDGAGRLTAKTDPMGNSIAYTLDAAGNPTAWTITEKDGGTNVAHSYGATYDVINRRLTDVEIDRTNSSNQLTTQNFYDSRSNLVFQINAMGNPTRWTFDCLNRMTKVERALTLGATINDFNTAQITQWGFDKNDRMVSHKDDAPNESTWAYDALDRATTMTYPDSTTVGYQHDLNGNVTQTTDPAGNVTSDTFDAANRNTSRSISLASGFLGTTSETRTFDGAGRMLTNEDNDYNVEFAYAVIGLRSYPYTETQSYVGMTAYAKTVTKTYDANGNKATEAYPSGSGLSLAYAWNDIDHLSSISDGTNTIGSYAWIGVRRKSETFQNGATRTNYYTGFRQEIESIRHETSAPATIIRLDYGHNAVHDRTYERYGSSGSLGDAFEYDKLRRLTVAWMGSTTPSSPSGNPYVTKIQYNMNDDGNRTSVVTTPSGQSAQTSNYSTNSLNEYTSVGGTSQSSDANGNLTDNGTYLFLYDYKNHIVQVKLKSSGSVIASYRYDALGRRVEKNASGTLERFVLSGLRVVSTFDGTDGWRQNLVWSDGIDDIQMLEQADVLDYDSDGNTTEITRSFYHRNALGSVMEITDMNQAGVVSYRYDPYGKVAITRAGVPQSSDPLGNHWTFTGRFLDEEAGLLYYRARYYDPATGRFMQRDPYGMVAGPTPYTYARDQPTASIDPLGLWPIRYRGTLPSLADHPHLFVVMDPIEVATNANWSWDDVWSFEDDYYNDLITDHELVHATSMGDAYGQNGAGSTVTVTGHGYDENEDKARKEAEADADSEVEGAISSAIASALDAVTAPEYAKDDQRKMPAYAHYPDIWFTSGAHQSWRENKAVIRHWTATRKRQERLGNKPWNEPPQAWATPSINRNHVYVSKSTSCSQESWFEAITAINGDGNITCQSGWRTTWHCKCRATATLPRRLTVTVSYPSPDIHVGD